MISQGDCIIVSDEVDDRQARRTRSKRKGERSSDHSPHHRAQPIVKSVNRTGWAQLPSGDKHSDGGPP